MNLHSAAPAFELTRTDYPTVTRLMTKVDATKSKSAVVLATGEDISADEFQQGWRGEYDTSFLRQIDDLTDNPLAVTGAVTDRPPQAYLFTAMSAIPVAATVKGYYATQGETAPVLASVRADTGRANAHFHPNAYLDPRAQADFDRHEQREIARLSNIIAGMEHVCVVDQYVLSGRTIRYGAYLAQQAGAHTVSMMRGRWYQQWSMTGDETVLAATEQLYSSHNPFMYRIGAAAVTGSDLFETPVTRAFRSLMDRLGL